MDNAAGRARTDEEYAAENRRLLALIESQRLAVVEQRDDLIAEARQTRTQARVAELFGVSPQAVAKIEARVRRRALERAQQRDR